MNSKKLFLLDGMALIYRSFFAFSKNPRITSYGLNVSAVFGMVNVLNDILKKEDPTHIAVVFDTKKATIRHEYFPEYKAGREKMPEDLSTSIPYIFELIKAYNIPIYTLDGYEADDIIGTLAKKAEKEGFDTYMMTPDKDFGQLVSEHIFMYKPARMGNGAEILGVNEILQKWEIENVHQVIDILGLWGDAVDNIPGIPGVGEKTAKKFIKQYGSIEVLLENTQDLKGKMKEKVEANKDQALLSKKLATILVDVPFEFNAEEALREDLNKKAIGELFDKLEFRTLKRRMLGESPQAGMQLDLFGQPLKNQPIAKQPPIIESESTSFKTVTTEKAHYKLTQTTTEIANMVKELMAAKEYCFDTETTGLDTLTADLVGIAFSAKKGTGYYLPIPTDTEKRKIVFAQIQPALNAKNLKIAHNLKFDLAMLHSHGLELAEPYFDTMLAHYLIAPDQRHKMDLLAEQYLNYQPIPITDILGPKGKNQLKMSDISIEKIVDYAVEDADITLQLKQILAKELKEAELNPIFNNIEMPLVPVLEYMERQGVELDSLFLNRYSAELEMDIIKLEQKIYEHAGTAFNIASPKQLGQILFDILQLDPKAKKTKTGQYKTGEEILVKLKHKHIIIENILEFRQLKKLNSTYVKALPILVNTHTNRIHTSFMQAVAATGRLSSQNPNLQNIPIRTKKGRKVREAFIPKNNEYTLLAADYSQIELRIIASLSEDENMMQAFEQGLDIHSATAALVFGIDIDNVDREMRSKAKAVNFGIVYGQGAFGLSQNLGIKRGEAKEIIDNYFERFPGIKSFMDKNIELARSNGYVKTMQGRKRYLPDINSANGVVKGFAERNAINAPIQGSAADMIKLAMIRVYHKLIEGNYKSKMILQVHDELVFDVYKPELDKLKKMVIEEMEKAMPLKVPVITDTGEGKNWLVAH